MATSVPRVSLRQRVISSVVILVMCSGKLGFVDAVYGPAWGVTDWAEAHATFYGGEDASGTMGGACGFGNLYSSGYGTNTAALSRALFNNGLTCGACFQIECQVDQSTYCYPGQNIIVTATDLCPEGSYGGWCDAPKLHFDLSFPMFSKLAQAGEGAIPIRYKRVSCSKQGGVRFTISGNYLLDLVLVSNVAGAGDVASVSVKGSNTGWFSTRQSWGQNWEGDNHPELVGQALSFQVTLGNGQKLVFNNVTPPNWKYGQTFETDVNFAV